MWQNLHQWVVASPGEAAGALAAVLGVVRAVFELMARKRGGTDYRATLPDALLDRIVRLRAENARLRREASRKRPPQRDDVE